MFKMFIQCVLQYLDVSLIWDILQDDGLHGDDVGKLHLGDVERTHNVGPALWERSAADQQHNSAPCEWSLYSVSSEEVVLLLHIPTV